MARADGLRATCPHFKARVDYMAGHWIQCRLGNKGFREVKERDQYYRTMCCGEGRGCQLIEIDDKRRRPTNE